MRLVGEWPEERRECEQHRGWSSADSGTGRIGPWLSYDELPDSAGDRSVRCLAGGGGACFLGARRESNRLEAGSQAPRETRWTPSMRKVQHCSLARL